MVAVINDTKIDAEIDVDVLIVGGGAAGADLGRSGARDGDGHHRPRTGRRIAGPWQAGPRTAGRSGRVQPAGRYRNGATDL